MQVSIKHPPFDKTKAVVYNEGDTVLDCFMGSGTTGVSCKRYNREFIGIEKEDKYFTVAKTRINVNY